MPSQGFSKFATVTALIFLLCSILVPTYLGPSKSELAQFAQKFGNATSTNPPVEVTSQYWSTVYYPWYGGISEGWEHWEDGVHIPPDTWSSMFLPDLGLYGSRDAATIDAHLSLLERARLDFALVSWWGRNSYEDRALSTMLTRASLNASLHAKLAVYYELAGYDVLSVADIVADLQYIYGTKANSPAYFRLADENGSYPVVFVYGIAGDPLEYTDRWSQARDQMYALGKPMFIVLKVWDGYRSYADKVDGWHQYAPATRYELQDGYSAFVSPGFWAIPELGGPFLPRSIEEFRIAVHQMAMLTLSQAKFLLIETFNEWHEGTQIEGGSLINHIESGFTAAEASYGNSYLHIVGNRGNSSPPEPPSPPQNVQASSAPGSVRVTWDAPSSPGGASILGYRIYRGINPDALTRLATLGDESSYNDTAASPGTRYYYRVRAFNDGGESDPSNTASATPTSPISTPTTLPITLTTIIIVIIAVRASSSFKRLIRDSNQSEV